MQLAQKIAGSATGTGTAEKNSEANCQSRMTTYERQAPSVPLSRWARREKGSVFGAGGTSWIVVQRRSLARCLIDGRGRRGRDWGRKGNRPAGGIDRVDLLGDVGSPLHVHAQPVVGADQCRATPSGSSGVPLRRDQLRCLVGMRRDPVGGFLVGRGRVLRPGFGFFFDPGTCAATPR